MAEKATDPSFPVKVSFEPPDWPLAGTSASGPHRTPGETSRLCSKGWRGRLSYGKVETGHVRVVGGLPRTSA